MSRQYAHLCWYARPDSFIRYHSSASVEVSPWTSFPSSSATGKMAAEHSLAYGETMFAALNNVPGCFSRTWVEDDCYGDEMKPFLQQVHHIWRQVQHRRTRGCSVLQRLLLRRALTIWRRNATRTCTDPAGSSVVRRRTTPLSKAARKKERQRYRKKILLGSIALHALLKRRRMQHAWTILRPSDLPNSIRGSVHVLWV